MESKRKIIFSHFKNPSNHAEIEELEKKNEEAQNKYFSRFQSSSGSCGDVIYLFIEGKNDFIKEALFNGKQSCLITFAFSDILCSWVENKKIAAIKSLISNVKKMLGGEKCNLDECKEMEVFTDIINYPARIGCIDLVIRGFEKMLELNQ